MNRKKRSISLVIVVFTIALLVYLATRPLAGIQLLQLYPWKEGVEGALFRYGDGYVSADGKWLMIQNSDQIAPQFTFYATTFPYEKIDITLPKPPTDYLYTISGWYANSWSSQGNRLFIAMMRWGPIIRMNRYCFVEVERNEQAESNCYNLPEDYYGFSWSTRDKTGLIYRVLDDGTVQLEVIDNSGKSIREVSINQLVHSPVKGKSQTMWALWDGSTVYFSQLYLSQPVQGETDPIWNIEVFSIPIEKSGSSELIYSERHDELDSRGVESQDPESGNLLLIGYTQGSPAFLVMDPETKAVIKKVEIYPPEGKIDTFGMNSYCLFDCTKTAWEVSIESGSSNKNYVMVWSWEDESYHFIRQTQIKGKFHSLGGFLCSRDIYVPLLKNPILLFSVCR